MNSSRKYILLWHRVPTLLKKEHWHKNTQKHNNGIGNNKLSNTFMLNLIFLYIYTFLCNVIYSRYRQKKKLPYKFISFLSRTLTAQTDFRLLNNVCNENVYFAHISKNVCVVEFYLWADNFVPGIIVTQLSVRPRTLL